MFARKASYESPFQSCASCALPSRTTSAMFSIAAASPFSRAMSFVDLAEREAAEPAVPLERGGRELEVELLVVARDRLLDGLVDRLGADDVLRVVVAADGEVRVVDRARPRSGAGTSFLAPEPRVDLLDVLRARRTRRRSTTSVPWFSWRADLGEVLGQVAEIGGDGGHVLVVLGALVVLPGRCRSRPPSPRWRRSSPGSGRPGSPLRAMIAAYCPTTSGSYSNPPPMASPPQLESGDPQARIVRLRTLLATYRAGCRAHSRNRRNSRR